MGVSAQRRRPAELPVAPPLTRAPVAVLRARQAPVWKCAIQSLRVPQWVHFLLLPAATLDAGAVRDPAGAALGLGRNMLVVGCALAWAYGINSVADRRMDLDARKNPLAGFDRASRAALALSCLALAAAVLVAAMGGRIGLAMVALSLVSAALYSVGPRLKALPLVGTLMNVPIFVPLLGVGAREQLPAAFPALAVALTALLLQNQLLHECADVEEDARGGVATTARRLGERRVGQVIIALGLVGGALAAALARSTALRVVLLAAIPVVILTAFPASVPAAARRRRHRFASLAAGGVIMAASLLFVPAAP